MRRCLLLPLVLALWPWSALACKCAESKPADLRATLERIALVEVVELGPEFDGQSPIPKLAARNRQVRVRIIEPLAGEWAAEETVEETLRVDGSLFDCSLYRRPGDRVILLLTPQQSLVDLCNTRAPDPTLVEALRGKRKGA